MKKTILIILIFLLIMIPAFSNLNGKNKNIKVDTVDLTKENKDTVSKNVFEEGNMENSGGASTVYVENIELINNFLDIDMMLKYKDLIISYGLLLPNVLTNDVDMYYSDNIDLIRQVFGIYSFSEFKDFYKLIEKINLNKKDVLSGICIKEITQEGNLLKIDADFIYGDKELSLYHYLSYVFIDGQPQLFIYY